MNDHEEIVFGFTRSQLIEAFREFGFVAKIEKKEKKPRNICTIFGYPLDEFCAIMDERGYEVEIKRDGEVIASTKGGDDAANPG